MTVYFTQGLTLLAVLYLIFSGQIKKLINKVSKAKVGNTEIEFGYNCHTPERRKRYRRLTDGVCPEHDNLVQIIKTIEKRIEKLEEHTEETWINALKNTFYNASDKMPLAEKLLAGMIYVWWGEQCEPIKNGEMKKDVLKMATNNKDVYQAIKKLRPELMLEEIEKKYQWPLV